MAENTPEPLSIRKLADTSEGTRVPRFDPVTGERLLVNPETNAVEPWPLAGIEIVGDAPSYTHVGTSWVAKGKAEGWITLEGEEIVHRPSGPSDNVWGAPAHTFVQAEALIIHTVDGDVRYKVVHQPDKYADNAVYVNDGKKTENGLQYTANSYSDETKVTDEHYANGQTRVDWFYGLELED